jgi:cysteine desulfurase
MIYLDNNATTPIAEEVFAAMEPFLKGRFGNPSSAHGPGRSARAALAEAREAVAGLVGAARSEEIVFTSGGTESDNWAIRGALEARPGKDEIITTRVEHEAVRRVCEGLEREGYKVTWIEVDGQGALDLAQLRDAISERTAVVSVMMANNETGAVFPVADIAEIVKGRSDALMHVDGVNAAGKIKIDLKGTAIDLFSISAHKFHGPKGVGALYIRSGTELPAFALGGGQESGRRAGTEAVHQIAGMGAAARIVSDLAPMEKVRELRQKLESLILAEIAKTYLNGPQNEAMRLPNTANISFANTNGEALLALLDQAGICVSTGSACNSETHTASPVLQAMNIPYSRAMGSIRFSLGRYNTAVEIDEVLKVLPEAVAKLRSIAGAASGGLFDPVT